LCLFRTSPTHSPALARATHNNDLRQGQLHMIHCFFQINNPIADLCCRLTSEGEKNLKMVADSYAHLAFLRTDEDAAEAIVRFRNVDVNNTTARRVYMRCFSARRGGRVLSLLKRRWPSRKSTSSTNLRTKGGTASQPKKMPKWWNGPCGISPVSSTPGLIDSAPC
jgi:hypothetical protein